MSTIQPIQNNPSLPQPTADFCNCRLSDIGLRAIKIVGALLAAAGVVCFTVSWVAPAVALLVSGAVLLVLGFVMPKHQTSLPPDPVGPLTSVSAAAPKVALLSADVLEKINAVPPVAIALNDEIMKIWVTMAGQAVGDGLGLATEFMSKAEAQAIVGDDFNFANPAFAVGWAGTFPRGGFTDDTEQATAIIRAVDQHSKHPEKSLEVHFAEQMLHWRKHGIDSFGGEYKSLKDPACRDVGNLTREVLDHPDFAEDPIVAAEKVWIKRDKPASNGSVMRTSVAGAIYHRDLKTVVEKTTLLAKVTHADPRSIAAAVALSVGVALFTSGHKSVEEVTHHSLEIAKAVLYDELETKKKHYANWEETYAAFAKDLEDHIRKDYDYLKLADGGKIGYAYKCVGAAFCALRKAALPDGSFDKAIRELIAEGGDADTNGAAAGALMAAYGAKVPDNLYNGLNPGTRAVVEENFELMAKHAFE